MADRVAKRSPARLCSRDGKLFYYRRVEYDFLAFFFAFASFFFAFASFFFSVLIPACFSSCSSVQQSARQQLLRFLLSFELFCLMPGFLVFL